MPRSATVWAVALLLASFSGSGPLLTTAEAMPAPGPQQTQGRPRYYFPRHIKRQIVTNSTAPAAPTSLTSSSSSSTSSERLLSREFPDFTSFSESLSPGRPDSASGVSKSDVVPTSSATPTPDPVITPVPKGSERLSGTGNLREPLIPLLSAPSSDDAILSSSAVIPSPTPTPTPSPTTPEVSPIAERPQGGSSGPLPSSIIQPTSVALSSVAAPTPSADSPLGGLLSSVLDPVVGPTGILPSSVIQPTSVAPSSVPAPTPSVHDPLGGPLSSLLDPLVGPTGALPSSVVQPTPSAVASVSLNSASPVAPTPTPNASIIQGPFIIPGSTGPLPNSILQPTSSGGLLGGLLSSVLVPLQPTRTPEVVPTGSIPIIVVPSSNVVVPSSDSPFLSLPTGGIVIGITTAFGTGSSAAPIPTPTPIIPLPSSGAIPTSEGSPASSGPLVLPSILSSVLSGVPGILPSITLGPTAPSPSASGALPPVVSSIFSGPASLLPSGVSGVPISAAPSNVPSISNQASVAPSGTAPILVSSGLPSNLPSSGVFPRPSETASIIPTPPVGSVTPSVTPSPSGGVLPSSGGILPSSGVLGSSVPPVSPAPTPSVSQSVSIPASKVPASTLSSGPPGSPTVSPPSSAASVNVVSSDAHTPVFTPSKTDSLSVAITNAPSVTSKAPSPVISLAVTASDSATSLVVGTNIIQETKSNTPVASPTSSGIPASLPKMIAPPGGVPSQIPQDSFMGQVCFKWPLNYPFVSANDGGNQIFHYLPIAIADGLNISLSNVKNFGLKPLDTTQYQGFITTLALFTIPKDLQTTLSAQLRNPADAFWHNQNSTVNDLTNLINTACPLPAAGDNSPANQAADPAATSTGGNGDGGALGGDIGASRKVNSTSAYIAGAAIAGAAAYGAAMFFVARRYRNKRMAHQRSSSVPSTSRMTYGSIPGGAAAWMHGARNGRITPASRGSRGSSSSQGRSIRTQQISAPVMAENSLGWN